MEIFLNILEVTTSPEWLKVFASYLGVFCIAVGIFFVFTGSMGLVRMPDFYTRLHPAGLIDSMGAPLVLLGFLLQHDLGLVTIKILLLILFLFITGPTATHAVAKSALLGGLAPICKIKDKKE